jgi:hypothetical protein
MLATTILLWALNLSATKYILEHGLAPLAYATVRYGLAGAVFIVLALATERSLRIERRHLGTLGVAAVILWLNQLAFVLALDVSAASTVGLLLGVMPIFAGLFGMALGRELDAPGVVLDPVRLDDAARPTLHGLPVRVRRVGHGECDVPDAVALRLSPAADLAVCTETARQHEPDVALLEHI